MNYVTIKSSYWWRSSFLIKKKIIYCCKTLKRHRYIYKIAPHLETFIIKSVVQRFHVIWFTPILNYNYHNTRIICIYVKENHGFAMMSCQDIVLLVIYYILDGYWKLTLAAFLLHQKFNTISRPIKRRYIRSPNRIDLYCNKQTLSCNQKTRSYSPTWRSWGEGNCKWTKTWFIYSINWAILW